MEPQSHASPHLTRLDAFRRHVNWKYNLTLSNYDQLHRWSTEEVTSFNHELWHFCGIVHSQPPSEVVAGNNLSLWPRPEWFPGARLNFTENVLATGLAAHPDKVAISACREAGTQWTHLTWKQLEQEVTRYASALRQADIRAGDRVASVLTNSIDAIVVMLASASIGAIFSSTSPEMGAHGIVDRYIQIEPKILFVEPTVIYGGAKRDLMAKMAVVVKQLREKVPLLQRVVSLGPTWDDESLVPLNEFLSVPLHPLEFHQVPFDHPIYILYSSGTTGPPKCICHSGGGALLKAQVDLSLSMDIGIDSTLYQYTTTGWMMWNLMVGALSLGSKIILYDGSPLHPRPSFQLRLIEDQGVTHWGTSPKFFTALGRDLEGSSLPSLPSLQSILSAGAPLSIEIYRWLMEILPARVRVLNGSGGTDVLGSIVGGNNLAPIYGNELSAPALGMKVEVWDEEGHDISHSGEKGELVITTPFPSMPVTFWGYNGPEKYRKAYFDKFPGIWCHGDSISQNRQTKGYVIHGRSDGILNPGGVRFGTAELYNVVDKFAQVEDCIAVGRRQPSTEDEQVLMFIQMKNSARLTESLRLEIQNSIKTSLSARHVPAQILEVQGIPYTITGKKVENVVKSIISGDEVKNNSAIANPECLREYGAIAKLFRVVPATKL